MHTIISSGLVFELNQQNFTASLCQINKYEKEELFIPESIVYQNDKYEIKRIKMCVFSKTKNIKSIKFAKNAKIDDFSNSFKSSKIKCITFPLSVPQFEHQYSINCDSLTTIRFQEDSQIQKLCLTLNESLESINFPSSIKEINQDIFKKCPKLNQIIISPNNKYYGYIDKNQKMIGKKSNPDLDYFDVLIFACRDISQANIPSNIAQIESYTFNCCTKLYSIHFSNNSKLKTLNQNVFSNCLFKKFVVPPSITKINENPMIKCTNLKRIEFDEKSKIRFINKNLFENSSIKSVLLPQSVNCIRNMSFNCCYNLVCCECLCDDLYFGMNCFIKCSKLTLLSCPNASQIYFSESNFRDIKKSFRLYLPQNAFILN